MASSEHSSKTLAICFGQFGPYHHARVAALQQVGREHGAGGMEHGVKVIPVQIAGATTTYAWKTSDHGTAGPQDDWTAGDRNSAFCTLHSNLAEGLQTLCEGVEEVASPFDVFLKARKLFREEKVDVAFLPSYSPARYFALLAAAKSLGIRTVMMNESHAGTEQATGWKRWIKRQIVKRFDAALVGGEPHKRHFASFGIPADKIFTGYDAVDNALFAARANEVRSMEQGAWSVEQDRKADEIRAAAKKSFQLSVFSVQQEEKADEVRTLSSQRSQSRGSKEQDRSEAEHLSTLNSPPSTRQSVRSAYGLPERYFLSLGRMVEKKNLSTLVEAYARFARASVEKHGAGSGEHREKKQGAGSMEQRANLTENCKLNTEHCAPALVFVGSGELEGALREQARGLGLRVIDRTELRVQETKRRKDEEIECAGKQADDCKLTPDDSAAQRGAVFFYGFRQIEENPVFYALAEAFVLPSLKEEWGLVVNEAMACSLPVIVSRTAGCAEDLLPRGESVQCSVGSVQSGENAGSLNVAYGPSPAIRPTVQRSTLNSLEERSNGFVFDPKSSDALAAALGRVADQKTKSLIDQETNGLTEMGRRSREVVAKFSCENFARQTLRAAEAAGS